MATLTNAIRFTANAALASPSVTDLLLDVFGGEVLTRYAEYLGISAMVRKKTITSGNTAVFPRLGGIGARRHAANTQLLGLDAESTELTIGLDDRPLVSDFVIDDIDEMFAHFDVRSAWAFEQGQALAESQDQFALRLIINASRETETTLYGGTNSNFPGGGIDGAGTALDISLQAAGARPTDDQIGTFLDGLDQIQERWDQVRVPFNERNVIVEVPHWHGIRQFGSPRSAADLDAGRHPLFMANDGRFGPAANQQQFAIQSPDFQQSIQYNGMDIWRSNICTNVYGVDLSNDEQPARYNGDFTTTRAVAWQSDAVAVVEKMAIKTETDRQVSFQNWLFVSSMLTGGGSLRAEASIEITDSD